MCNVKGYIHRGKSCLVFGTGYRFWFLLSLFLLVLPAGANAVAVGDTVINPITGATETVVQVLDDGTVFTDQDNAILTRLAIGDKYTFGGTEYAIDSVTTNPAGRVIEITLKETGGAGTITRDTLTAFTVPDGGTTGITPGNPGGPVTVPIPSGNVNVVHDYRVGARGSDGRNGYGVELCIGVSPLRKCFIAGRSGHSGDPGGNGPTISRAVTPGNNGNIQTITPGLSGITVISQGGNGGDGGDSFGSLPPLNGGAAGLGGTVIVNSSVDISTSGERAHGIFAQSRGGKGGDGGGGYIFSGGGAGGPASAGGSVTAINSGEILTTGNHAVGLFAQSIGGGGGAGGDSYGLVGDVNSGSIGGNGGRVVATNSGGIETRGVNSYGIQAQSIGGTGGNTGNAGGIIALGGASPNAGGGAGGSVLVNNLAGGTILTRGRGAVGVFAQSVGGGGGSAGVSAGIVAFGSQASRGGNGGTVEVKTQAGSSVQTQGEFGHGIFAQSVGGGGGAGGATGGLVALGGSGNTAGNGGVILVENEGLVITRQREAKGIFAQSVGGGGGSASGVGGAISLGGSGGAGGSGNTVTVVNGGSVQTLGQRGDAIFAQSVGGGGGSGAASGGIVAIGGSGTQGGSGNTVNVQNNGALETAGHRARGIFAQSVGGGGGSGGSTGGIIAIGGSGGGGGNGGVVNANNSGSIATQGHDASGVFAQSVGGGGGDGGSSVAAGVLVAVGIGGSAGNGGAGGTATVALAPRTVIVNGAPTQVDPLIATQGDRSNGILVQSVGGGGGNGGFSTSVAAGAFGAASVSIGGRGGNGGAGGVVGVSGNGAVTTQGVNSDGVLAQSVGGGGGNGGMVTSVALAAGQGGAVSAALGIGGSGGGGGVGGRVQIRSGGSITTNGTMSDGLVAQSIGGGGGNGGHSLALAGAASDKAAVGVSVGIGGTGGNGGSAGEVDAVYSGDVTTRQADSTAVLLQAVGGGGGNGGYNVSGAIAAAKAASGAGTVGIGGSGGAGGNGGTVTGLVNGTVRTEAERSDGVVAQSVGGGGGNGGFNVSGSLSGAKTGAGAVAIGVGGSGGNGGVGSTVNLTVNGTTTTSGQDSAGVTAQSIGGGGGNGGFNVSGTIAATLQGTVAGTVSVGVGGAGGGGGSGGRVISNVTGAVGTQGKGATGTLAQSVGGGGGDGGFNVAGGLAILSQSSGTVSVGVGGFGGGGGTGGHVDFTRSGNTVTQGVHADAVVGQSIGGGGGNGAINISSGIAASKSGTTAAVNIGIGGFGGSGGAAGNVKGRVIGDVIATGENIGAGLSTGAATLQSAQGSNGVVAQSVGGGGGNGGINVSGGPSLSAPSGGSNFALTLGLGGFGGSGGHAGSVDLVVLAEKSVVGGATLSQGVVAVNGAGKSAVLAQSVGGGGGNGAINVSGGISMDGAITAGVGGSGGSAGRGGNVIASVTGDVMATGMRSRGMVAQSVGGGGGDGSTNISGGIQANRSSGVPSLSFGLGGAGGSASSSGTVAATQTGSVSVAGVDSIGILAQSVAGGGGSGGLNVSADLALGKGYNAAIGIGGNGGAGADSNAVSLTSNGMVTVDGTRNSNDPFTAAPLAEIGTNFSDHANGILVQSIGGGGGSGGVNVAGAISPFGSPLVAGVGGTGGAGGNGGTVLVNRGQTTQSLLQTIGNHANALTAQSIGGGGGDAAINIILAASRSDPPAGQSMLLTVGGSGGAAGNASTVTVNQKGEIRTTGTQSAGLLAQSIGGGGGNANFNFGAGFNKGTKALNLAVGGGTGNGGTGGSVAVDHTGNITTASLGASALVAQSVGGGGGNAALSLAVNLKTSKALNITLGRTGGTGGAGGAVSVAANGVFSTSGDMASAIVAQSVGNGGGSSTATTVGVESQSGDGTTKRSQAAQLSIGLQGGSGGTGGRVVVGATGAVVTNGSASHGVHAQSVGGGGGTGGAATNVVYQESATIKVGVGGTGGSGAKSGSVDVTSTANIATNKQGSHGIYAQSIGGAGGSGGKATTVAQLTGGASANGSITATVGVGGQGGTGAEADTVKVINSGIVETKADQSAGIAAQSIGGGGGDGGLIINQTTTGEQDSNAVSLAVGGSGGTGGVGRTVTVENGDAIKTAGKGSYGIQAQSIGGGGGNGSVIINNILQSGRKAATIRLDVSIGGSGGSGGSSGNVVVTNQNGARIDTGGEGAHGIFAQAIGGGGGNGSSVITQNTAKTKESVLAGFSLGGSGGSGSTAGNVSVTNNGAIQTTGRQAHGIFAQSIGGGGGNGGTSVAMNTILAKNPTRVSPLLAIGGRGGSGENAGDVAVNNTGTIRTEGKHSNGIVAQSIGGGGGNAALGLNLAAGKGAPAVTILANTISAIVGSTGGGSGGLGGRVTVDHSGDITVVGAGSQAIVAQSINGGGGGLILDMNSVAALRSGSFLPVGGGSSTSTSDPAIEIVAGGKGTENMSAGAVTVTVTGTFGLTGDNNTGTSVQSIGGGGGTTLTELVLAQANGLTVGPMEIRSTLGGENGRNNHGAAISGSYSGELLANGANTHGVLLQTIGGGGGRSTFTVDTTDGEIGPATLKLGATNGTSETGGAITYSINGAITMIGDQSLGVLVQSLGGGGGIQTFDTTLPSSTAVSSLSAPQPASGFASSAVTATAPVNLVLGANGGVGNHGGAINLTRLGDTALSGENASAIVHQSIGAGGGIEQVSAGDATLNIQLGGQAGANGNGDAVTLTNTGNVMTTGSRSHGIFLQSIGGGGGAVFHDADANQVSNSLSAANSGNGGAVTLVQTGDVMTGGSESFGIVMQSIGGGGGFIDGVFAGTAGGNGSGAAVDLTLDGSVATGHETSTAILAQSTGTSGGDISVAVKAGRLVSGGAKGIGLDIRGGADNTITNEGAITTASLARGLAISGTTGNETIDNTGLVSGSVTLATGTNRFNNAIDTAQFHTGETVDLGLASHLLFNNGIVQPGDTGRIDTVLTTELGGTYTQTATANYEADLDFVSGNTLVGKIDRINATGSAQLDGTFDLFIVNPNAAAPGTHEVTFFTTQQDMTSQNLTLNAPPSAVAMYDILYPSRQEAKFQYIIDFSPVGLNGNQTAFGDYINNVQLAGGSNVFANLVGTLFVIPTLEELKTAYDSLIPEPYADNLATTVTSIDYFSNAMMSCRDDNGDYGLAQRNCVWAQGAVVEQDYSGNSSHFAYTEESHIFAMGFLGDVTDKLYLGLAGSFEKTSFNSGNNAWGEGERPQAGVVLEYRDGANLYAGSLIGGVGHFDTTRMVNVGSVGGITSAKQRVGYVSTNVRWSHFLDYGNRYLMPSVDGSAIYMHQRAFTETGGGLTNLSVDMKSQLYASVEPSIEAGGDFDLGTSTLRAKARVGVLQRFGDVPAVEASLVGTPAGVSSFTTTAGQDKTLLTVTAGLDWILDSGVNLRASIGGQFGKDTSNKQGSFKVTVPF